MIAGPVNFSPLKKSVTSRPGFPSLRRLYHGLALQVSDVGMVVCAIALAATVINKKTNKVCTDTRFTGLIEIDGKVNG